MLLALGKYQEIVFSIFVKMLKIEMFTRWRTSAKNSNLEYLILYQHHYVLGFQVWWLWESHLGIETLHSLILCAIHLCVLWKVCWSLDKQILVVLQGIVGVGLGLLGEFVAILFVLSIVCELNSFYWGAGRLSGKFR